MTITCAAKMPTGNFHQRLRSSIRFVQQLKPASRRKKKKTEQILFGRKAKTKNYASVFARRTFAAVLCVRADVDGA